MNFKSSIITKTSIADRIKVFQKFGLFKAVNVDNREELVRYLLESADEGGFGYESESDIITSFQDHQDRLGAAIFDYNLLSLDRGAVFGFDAEGYIDPGCYEQFLIKLQKCSGGVFGIGNISEEWKALDDGYEFEVTLSFDLGEKRCNMVLNHMGDWIDSSIIDKLSIEVKRYGVCFLGASAGQCGIAVCIEIDKVKAFTCATELDLMSGNPEIQSW